MSSVRLTAVALAFLLCIAASATAETLTKDTVWSGTVKVAGQVVVEKGATLTIRPGTKVVFMPGRQDDEGLSDSGIVVKGSIIAKGKPGARITFTSGTGMPKPGDWGEIKIFESPGSVFRDCDFSYGGWGLHVHESSVKVTRCTFTQNSFGGIRGKAGDLEVAHSRIEGMDIGLRYWKGSPYIHHNTITGNGTGIFLRQECGGAKIKRNNIYGNSEYDVKLGDAQKEDVDLSRNWWGGTDTALIRMKIFDREREPYIGRAKVTPVLKRMVAVEIK